ncbi:relaxase domain-containing protein [Pseudonocardia sp. MCCB 268]|nr:relaxase domain-containing protein [Pseudonocardia cytotoxica]
MGRDSAKAVQDAIWAGNNAALAYLRDKAGYSRVGHHSGTAGATIDARTNWTVASFFQHDSRDHDPQLPPGGLQPGYRAER